MSSCYFIKFIVQYSLFVPSSRQLWPSESYIGAVKVLRVMSANCAVEKTVGRAKTVETPIKFNP